MDQIIIEEAPCVPLFYDEVMHFVHKRVHGFSTNSLNLIELKKVSLD
jgi:peptide/nickel transport system substrate-binding protein